MKLCDWIEFGKAGNRGKLVKRWLFEARGHVPVIDRVNYPNDRRAYPGRGR